MSLPCHENDFYLTVLKGTAELVFAWENIRLWGCMSIFLLWIFNMKYMSMYMYQFLNEHYVWAEVEPMSVEWPLWTEPLLGCVLSVLLVKWIFLVFNIKHVEVQKLRSIAQLSKLREHVKKCMLKETSMLLRQSCMWYRINCTHSLYRYNTVFYFRCQHSHCPPIILLYLANVWHCPLDTKMIHNIYCGFVVVVSWHYSWYTEK